MAEQTIEEMERRLELAQEILKTKERTAALNAEEAQAVLTTNNLLDRGVEQRKEQIKQLNEQITKIKASDEFTAKKANKQIKARKETINAYKNEIKFIQKNIEGNKKLIKEKEKLKFLAERVSKAEKDRSEALARTKKSLVGLTKDEEKLGEKILKNRDATEMVADGIRKATELSKIFASTGAEALNMLPETILAKYMGFQIGLGEVGKEVEKLPVQFDKAFAGVVKATGMPLEAIKGNLQAAMDPEGAVVGLDGFRESLEGLGLTSKDMFVDIGISVEDSKDALTSLIAESSLFRADFLKNEPAAASVTANLVAGLKKVGVQTKTSAKLIDVFTKAFGKAPVEAGKSLKSVAGIATSLGMDINKVFGNFESSMPTLSQFGSEMTEVFADLQARSAATGAEMGKLVSIAMKMDTFEGAAKAAQTLNGVLGDTLISVTDLAHADPDEKFDMIAEAVNNSGVEFESLNRRYKSIIASAAGFDNVAEFQRQLLGEEAVDEAKAAVDTGPLTTENLAERAKQGMDMQDKSKASVSSFGVAAVKAYEAASGAAEAYNNVIKNSLIKTARTLKGDLGKTFIAAREGLAALGGAEDRAERKATRATETARSRAQEVIGVGAVLKAVTQTPADTGPQADAGGAAGGEITNVRVASLDPEANTALVEFTTRVVGEEMTKTKEAALAATDGSQYA